MMELSNRTEYLWPNLDRGFLELFQSGLRLLGTISIRTEDLWNYSNQD